MHITALVKGRDHVCCRYRIAPFAPSLEAHGHHVEIQPWSSSWFVEQMFLGNTDTLVIQRKLFPSWQLKCLRGRTRWLIYDFDDSIFLRSSYNPLGLECPRRLEQFRQMMQAADVVVAGNGYLRAQANVLTDPAKVRMIPTCVDVSRYPQARHDAARRTVKLAWIGSASTLRGLERIQSLLDQLGQVVPELELKIVCDRSLPLHHLPVDFCRWSEASEGADLADADIGISWLPDDGWSAGKCGLKVLQYMAAGLPVIANPVGVQAQLVRHGVNGFLVNSPDDWRDAAQKLARDADLRRRMGAAGRRRVEADYDVAHGAAKWQDLASELASRVSINTHPRGTSLSANSTIA